MDAALVVITLLSLGLTGALLVYAARLQREAQQRSEARVAALAAEIRRAGGLPVAGDVRRWKEPAPADVPLALPRKASAPAGPESRPVTVFRGPAEGTPARVEAEDLRGSAAQELPAPNVSATGAPPAPSSRFLFESGERDDRSRSRVFLTVGAGVAVLAILAVVLGGGRGNGPAEGAGAAAAEENRTPLELVALRHTRAASTLTVSGVVRNPADAPERKGLGAVVFLFGRNGSFLTSGRAAIDYQTLTAGDESPFVVTIPNAGDVGRYRVSFRSGDAIVPHVDRRAQSAAVDEKAASVR